MPSNLRIIFNKKAAIVCSVWKNHKRLAYLWSVNRLHHNRVLTMLSSNVLFNSLADNVRTAIIAFDSDGRIVFVNEQLSILFGIRRETIFGKNIAALEESNSQFATIVREISEGIARKGNFRKKYSIRTKNEAQVQLHLHFYSVVGGAANDDVFYCLMDEISSSEYFVDFLFDEHIRYQEYLNDMPLLICRYNAEGIISYSNKFYYSVFGGSSDETRSIKDDFAARSSHELQELLMPTTSTNQIASFEVELQLGGCSRWFIATTQRFFDSHSGSQLREYQLVCVEITAQKMAELELIEEKRKMHQLINAIDDMIVVFDRDLQVELLNTSASLMRDKLNLFESVVIGKQLSYLSENNSYPANDRIARVFETQKPDSAIYRYSFKDKVYVVEHRFFPILRHGKVEQVVAIHRNQTEERKREMQIAKSQQMLNTLVENAMVGIINFDKDGGFIFTNSNFDRMVGYAKDELMRMGLVDISFEADLELSQQMLARLVAGEINQYTLEKRFVRKDGSVYWADVFVSAIRDRSGQFLSGICINQDISKRKLYEEQLRQNEKSLAQLVATKDKFFSIIAHDLKGPFATISLLAKNSPKKCPYNDKCPNLRYLNLIKEASDNGYNLLSNLLTWSKDQAGLLKCRQEPLVLSEIVAVVMRQMEIIANVKSISINNLIGRDIEVYADRNMLKTVFRNLLSNAIKYSYPQGQITCHATSHGDKVTIQVIDNGVGIPPELLPTIFTIEGAVSTKGTNNEDGTGIGLVMCREFVEKNGGEIWVNTTHGKGSVFSFTLPAIITGTAHT